MGAALGPMLGTSGGAAGTGFSAPTSNAGITTPVTQAQVDQSTAGVGNSLAQQQALLSALQTQGGLQQQNNAGAAIAGTNQGLTANNGIGNQASTMQQTQALGAQLAANNGAGNAASQYSQGQQLSNQLAANNGAANQAGAMTQQQGLNSQLAGANGVGAQTGALSQQGQFNQQLQQANGVGAQNAAIAGLQGLAAQQQATAGQYQNIANGTGPNPAQAALNQNTGANVAAQGALMAGQRGAGSNVGLMARQAAQQGAATQQAAVGQGATLQAQQQLAGLSGLSAQQQAMGSTQQAVGALGTTQAGLQQAGIGQQAAIGAGLTGAQQTGVSQQAAQASTQVAQQQAQQQALMGQSNAMVGQQQTQQGLQAGQAQNQVSNQLAANQLGANQANTVAGQQISATGQNVSGNVAAQGNNLSAAGANNTTLANLQGNVNTNNAALANTGMQGQQGLVGGLLNNAGAGASMVGSMLAKGGEVKMADGGTTPSAPMPYAAPDGNGPTLQEPQAPLAPEQQPGPVTQAPPPVSNSFADFLIGKTSTGDYAAGAPEAIASNPITQPPDTTGQQMTAPSQWGPGTQQLFKGASNLSGQNSQGGGGGGGGGGAAILAAMAKGGKVTGKKVPAEVSEGEVIVPAKITKGKDPVRKSAEFVKAAMARGGAVKANNPKQKATVKGDSYANDKIPEDLEVGSIVIPRHVMQGKDPVRGAAQFVQAAIAKRGKK